MDATNGFPSTVADEKTTGPKLGMVFEVEMAPNWTRLGAVDEPTELAVSLTPEVVSDAVTDVAVAVSEVVMAMTSPPLTGNRKEAVPAEAEMNVIGVPWMHSTFRPALATKAPRVRATHNSTLVALDEEHEMLLAAGTVMSAVAAPTTGAE
jgi:hypothetical protein